MAGSLLPILGRDPAYFDHVRLKSVADELLRRIGRALGEVPIRDNYFVEYFLTGQYADLEIAHPHLHHFNFQPLKDAVGGARLFQGTLGQFLDTVPCGSVSKFNLSDIFEYMSRASFESARREISRVGRDQSRLACWTLLVPRFVPPVLSDRSDANYAKSKELFVRDRTFFYGNFHAWHCRALTTRNGFDENL